MVTMPFQMLQQFNQNTRADIAQDRANEQNMLMQMFQTEAARQAPYSSYPVDIAKQNNASQNALNNSMAMATYNQGMKTRRDAQLKMAPEAIRKTITNISQQFGEDPHFFMHLAAEESGFDPTIMNKQGSGAGGLFQYMPKTAAGLGMRDEDRFNPEIATRKAIEYNNQNRTYLERALGRKINQGEMYLAWQQGAGGAEKLLKNPNARAVDIVGQKAVTMNGGNVNMTAQEFANLWINRFQSGYERRIANLKRPSLEQTPEEVLQALALAQNQDQDG